jgi:hypothetical protein
VTIACAVDGGKRVIPDRHLEGGDVAWLVETQIDAVITAMEGWEVNVLW